MKLVDLLEAPNKETEAFTKWCEVMNVRFYGNNKTKNLRYKVSKGIVSSTYPDRHPGININRYGKEELNMLPRNSTETLKWVAPPVHSWEHWDDCTACGLEMDDWATFPNVPSVLLANSLHNKFVINSLKNIDKLDKIRIIRVGSGELEINCGLLKLLKMPELKAINVGNPDEKVEKAFKIINSHLKDRDVPECQQELIEEGLQEFATL